MAASNFSFLATCVPGAEPWLQKELVQLGVAVSPVEGGVEGRATLSAIRDVMARTRLAEAIRVRPSQAFEATSFELLQRGLNKVPWHAYLVPEHQVEVRVTCKQSRLYHSDAVAQRAQGAVRRGPNQRLVLAQAPDINTHRNRVYLRLHRDRVQVSIDAAGEALHRRGYRPHVHEAPLRETLAALLLSIANEAAARTVSRLWDPFCGSGTIPLEWLDAQGAPQTKHPRRRFILDEWPCARQLEPTNEQREDVTELRRAWFSDIAARAIDAARANASLLAAEGQCTFIHDDFEAAAAQVPEQTAIVTNVPYGVRLSTKDEANQLLARLERLLLRRVDLRPAVVLWAGSGVPRGLQAKWESVLNFKNGGLRTSIIVLR